MIQLLTKHIFTYFVHNCNRRYMCITGLVIFHMLEPICSNLDSDYCVQAVCRKDEERELERGREIMHEWEYCVFQDSD